MSIQIIPTRLGVAASTQPKRGFNSVVAFAALVFIMVACQTTGPGSALHPVTPESAIEGVWQDTKWGDLLTLRREKGKLRAAAVIDNKTAEEFVIQDSAWQNNALTFRYRIQSNDTNVISTISGLDDDLLAGTWRLEDDTNSGEFRYRKIMAIAPPPEITDDEKKTVHQPIAKVYRVQSNTITITSAAMAKVKMHDKLYVLIDGRKVYISVVFPMMTIARCKPMAANNAPLHRITEGMTVYR